MLFGDIDSYKLEDVDVLESQYALMHENSDGESISVVGVAKVLPDKHLGEVRSFRIVDVTFFDVNGEKTSILRREQMEAEDAKALEDHLTWLLNDEHDVLVELCDLARERERPYQPCEMTIAKERQVVA